MDELTLNTPEIDGVRILSDVTPENFPALWYGLASEGHFWCAWRMRAFIKQLRSLRVPFEQPLLGLEIGCGNGLVRRQLEEVSLWTVDGADINLAALQTNKTRRGATLLYSIHERRTEFEAKYDFVLLFDVLEHIPDHQTTGFLESCLFHLKPGGYLFLNVPALMGLFSKYDEYVGHFRRYDKRTLGRELNQIQATIEDIRYWGTNLLPIAAARKVLLARASSIDAVVKRGFRPPSNAINTAFNWLGAVETSVLSNPPCGTSLLAACRKT
ncbi:MAG: class I SAM-dependent methyltransferase [Candidatus Hydrogenedentes bacterium]|nr:class I SAM-dependent methyltransferase [Candidatus Hydrogenedentota bacterium]